MTHLIHTCHFSGVQSVNMLAYVFIRPAQIKGTDTLGARTKTHSLKC